MSTPPRIDLEALAAKAGIPSDEPAVREFARLIAIECMQLCYQDRNDADLSWLPRHHIRAAQDNASASIAEAFGFKAFPADAAWIDEQIAVSMLLCPEAGRETNSEGAYYDWESRFADRVLELDPGRDIATARTQAQAAVVDGWADEEPGLAASQWFAEQTQSKAG